MQSTSFGRILGVKTIPVNHNFSFFRLSLSFPSNHELASSSLAQGVILTVLMINCCVILLSLSLLSLRMPNSIGLLYSRSSFLILKEELVMYLVFALKRMITSDIIITWRATFVIGPNKCKLASKKFNHLLWLFPFTREAWVFFMET